MKNEKKLTFEEALGRLEEIVRSLENGGAKLEDSLSLFEEGVGLVKLCGKRLDEAEQKIALLVKNDEGGYDERPFEAN